MGAPLASSAARPLMGSTFCGMMPWGWDSSSGSVVAATALGEAEAVEDCVMAVGACAAREVTLTAMRPGRMTRKGKNIFGTAAMMGTLRADSSLSAAMA